MTHTPEPWAVDGLGTLTGKGDRFYSIPLASPWVEDAFIGPRSTDESKANARRIVAAVNATAGIPTDALEAGAVRELVEAARDALAGWQYIRQHHGDLYGVGWDRVEQSLTDALAKVQP